MAQNNLNKRLVVLGSGESGVGAAVLGKKQGYEVFVSDKGSIKAKYKTVLEEYGIKWEEQQHSEDLILNATEVVKSPGIPDKVGLVQKLVSKNIPVISEIEFAGRFTDAKMICITGSNGKTTTTLLTYHVLQKAGLNVGLAGNVGHSLAMQVANDNYDYFVLELSSFQLDGMFNFKADIAMLMNITPDHLDRYDYKMQNYVDSKFRILQNMDENGVFIYWNEDPVIIENLQKQQTKAQLMPFSLEENELIPGAYIADKQIYINTTNKQQHESIMSVHDLALKGKHNANNSMAAGIASRVLEIRKEIIRESLSDFQNVEHRLEFVARIHGIEFINDSKATNVNSTWYALESIDKPIVWIAGGVDKGNDYSELEELVKAKVSTIICLGKDVAKLHEAFEGYVDSIIDVQSAEEAVAYGYRYAKKEQVVLLSPACASFDLFENYEDRGTKFKKAVKAL